MQQTLIKLGFAITYKYNTKFYSKSYGKYRLWIAKFANKTKYVASIKIDEVEISIPLFVTKAWLESFNIENSNND